MLNFDYHNPNDNWGYDPYKGMDDDERVAAGYMSGLAYIIAMAIGVLICSLFSSCTTTQYVPVTEQHTEHHWHTDSVKERDSIHTENTTIIREVDSAAMAKYGIQMQANQRAWLVLQREMENRLRELEHMSTQLDTVRDSIPVPYPVEKVVERKRSAMEWGLIFIGIVALMVVIVIVVWKLKRFLPVR